MFSAQKLAFARDQRVLFRSLSFTLSAGQGIVLCGENGSGKSTLLKILAGFIHPVSGAIFFESENIQDSLAFATGRFFLGHQLGLKGHLTPKEMAAFFYAFRSLPYSDEILQKQLTAFHLETATGLIAQLSAGQRQRLALALAFSSGSSLLLLDEPTSNLDPAGQQLFDEKIQQHLEGGGMIVFSSHQPERFSKLPLTLLTLGSVYA